MECIYIRQCGRARNGYININIYMRGISLTDRADLEKAPRWAKTWSKNVFKPRHAWTFVIHSTCGSVTYRAQELCESRGGRPGFPVSDSPYGLCGRKAILEEEEVWLTSHR